MILRSIEEGVSFKIKVFPMAQPSPGEGWTAEPPQEYTALLFFEILEVLEPVVAAKPTDEDPDGWEGSPLHNEVIDAIQVGNRHYLCFAGGQQFIELVPEFSANVQIVEE